jgi:hypothetical protein
MSDDSSVVNSRKQQSLVPKLHRQKRKKQKDLKQNNNKIRLL